MTKNYKNLNFLLNHYRLILASASPRRVYILNKAKIAFRQLIPDIKENIDFNINPHDPAVLLAGQKARAVLSQADADEIILGCDTIVIFDNRVLGKPATKAEAIDMLSILAGNRHTVCTAIALLSKNGLHVDGYELTDVFFNSVSHQEIVEYVNSGEPLDKAGAYGIQDKGVFLVDRVVGNIDNVIGLPMTLLENYAGKMSELKGLKSV